jgi:hypothetical protein
MSELEELKLAYAECSRQRNTLLNKLKAQENREWVWLTDEGIHGTYGYQGTRAMYRFARAIEAASREKNT